ncbi:peptidylprolyl isomerase [Gammaproteobacteria bacterium]|jgi:peptidyl-prolyl cis-trans isomerase SurA|nr:peptidylprolyl isomerase [Gammaproteobacteria bacterium]MDC0406395.1 peptidylprolyl isomerase [Gammaproteobacteria bacterium]MDC0420948.1 peptidylprolyl isomerase [Gammaproteobacteria bacterium]MDC1170793.1 peptidylprolyl isomerase [Gammaproteobacteria bacterium]|tara:strand:- start:972 stop:2213 length:1242 start_codon:yes stop_codon:yes gene_type:complete
MKKIILILACSLSANTYASIEVLDRIAVIVDDGLIMESQIKSGFKEIVSLYEEQNIPLPGTDNLKDQVIESLIIEELQLQMANRAGVRISDSELNDAITRIANNSQMELEEFIAYIENDGESYESFRENVRKQMLIQRVQRGKVGSEINITEKEFAAFMETDESLVELEPELFVRQILVRGSDEADAVILRIENGEEFFEIAKEVSISSNSINGGELPWRKIVDMPELFSNALKNEDIGFISEPLKSGAGFHILKVEDKRGPFVQYEDQWFSRHILLSPSAIRDEESTELEINAIRDRVLNGEEFADLAEEYSEDPGSAKQGGNLDWLGKDVLAPEFEKVMIDSSIGIVSEVFQTQFGFHFLEVLEKRNYDMTRDLIEDRAYQLLYGRKYEEELENTLRSMRADAFVEIKDLD